MRVAILGAGDMGTAIATPLAANRVETRIWGTQFDDQIVAALRARKPHPRLKHHLPPGISIFSADNLSDAVADATIVVLAVTSPAVDAVLDDVAHLIRGGPIVVSLTKGLISGAEGRVELISERIAARTKCCVVGVGGPSKANEVAMEIPTAVVFGSPDPVALRTAHDAFETPVYRVIETSDIHGVEMAGALKNAYAIAVGVGAGMEQASGLPHENFKAAVLSEALRELACLAVAAGAKTETIYGLAGVGDLSVTVSAGRNRLLGELIGRDIPIRDALATLSATDVTIEGFTACELGHRLVRQLTDAGRVAPGAFPLLDALHRVLFENAPPFTTIWDAVCR
jgi:glycerol-3-phosphate dehydrogenase (NAD(P)+)